MVKYYNYIAVFMLGFLAALLFIAFFARAVTISPSCEEDEVYSWFQNGGGTTLITSNGLAYLWITSHDLS